jgi:hypothetical protein
MIPKKGSLYRDVLALRVTDDHVFAIEAEGSQGNTNRALLSEIAISEVNLDQRVKPSV